MFGVWIAADVFAGDVEFEVSQPDVAELPLFSEAMLSAVRGTTRGGDCAAAVLAASADASESLGDDAVAVRIVRSLTDPDPLSKVLCKQRMAGDNVSASVVEVTILSVIPGSGPPTSVARTAEIASQLSELSDDPRLRIGALGEGLWVLSPQVTEPAMLDSAALDSNERGALLYERYVSPWVVRWARPLVSIPEVSGASLEIAVTHEDPGAKNPKKTRKTELFRFIVPTNLAVAFASGEINDEALVKGSRVERATDPKRRDFLQFLLDLEDAGMVSDTDRAIVPKTREGLDELDNIDIEDE